MNNNRLIVVLGMHRSGTSAITRGLQVFGVNLGDKLMPPIKGDNDKGFFEDLDLNALNIEMLEAIGSDWHYVYPIDASDVETLYKKGYFLRAVELIRLKVGNVPSFGFKDPRVAKLLPFWKKVLEHCQYDVGYVLVVRHPLSVVKSLVKRNGFSLEKCYMLWLGHVLTSLSSTEGYKRVLIDYDRLLKAPERELARIADHLALKIDSEELQSYKLEFLDDRLRHTVYTLDDLLLDGVCHPLVYEIYAALLDVSADMRSIDDAELKAKIAVWNNEFERLKSNLLMVDKLTEQIDSLSQAVDERDRQIVNLNQTVAERDGQITSLNQAVDERDRQIASLNLRSLITTASEIIMAERDWQITSLNQSLVERDWRIASLNQTLAGRDEQIASLNQIAVERDAAIELMSAIKCSTSWRITAPLRFFGHLLRGDLTTVGNIVRYVVAALVPKRLSRFLKRQLNRLLSLTGLVANSTANYGAIAMIISERCAFTHQTPARDPLTADLPSEPPNVDISVVTYNSSRWVDAFTESLIDLDYPKYRITVFFVDNSSTDSTVEFLQTAKTRLQEKGYKVNIMQQPNRGFGAGHNVAIRAGSAPFCLITNIDLTFERNALARLVATALADVPNAAAWEPRQKPYEHPKFYDPVTGTTNWNSHACVLLRRSALESIGGYDENLFMYGEDVELSYRLRRAGFVLRYCPFAVVLHYSYEDTGRVKPLQYTGSTFANLYLRLKYGNRIDIFAVPLMSLRLVAAPEVFPGSRWAVLRNLAKLAWVAPKALLLRRRSKAYFPFRTWDYEMIRDGAFVQVPPLRGDTPLVSVITRTYRGREALLRQALLSVAHQSYPSIEHVVIEDGDDTMREVVEGIASATGRYIRFIGLDKVGRSAAGNTGLKVSSGRWCLFLDDDDLVFGDHIEVLVNALHNDPDAVAAYSLAWEVVTSMPVLSSEGYREVTHGVPMQMRQEFDHAVLSHHNFMPIQSVLFERRLFVERGGFEEDMDALEDWTLWNRYAHGNRFIYVPKVTSLFRTPADPARISQRQDALNAAYPLALARAKAICRHPVGERIVNSFVKR